MSANTISWSVYSIFATAALYLNWHPDIFSFTGNLGILKLVVWVAFAAFLAYSVYCSFQENIFRTIRKIAEFHWGKQIGINLYLGLFMFQVFIYLHEGSLAAVLWLVPTILFANLSALLYLGIHFDSIASKLLGL